MAGCQRPKRTSIGPCKLLAIGPFQPWVLLGGGDPSNYMGPASHISARSAAVGSCLRRFYDTTAFTESDGTKAVTDGLCREDELIAIFEKGALLATWQ